MTFSVATNIENTLSSIDTAMTVLEAAIERAESCGNVEPDNATAHMWQVEVSEICKLMVAAARLMQDPVEALEDVKGAAYQLASDEKVVSVA